VVAPPNRVLAALAPEDYRRLEPHLERIPLSSGKVLYDYGDAPRFGYFPVSGMLSVRAAEESGSIIQVAAICNDGFVGLPIVLGSTARSQVVVELPGDAYRIRAGVLLQEFRREGTFRSSILLQLDRLIAESAQAIVCHRYHSVRQRICRWLLLARDCTGLDTIHITQEHIAEVLAVPRSAVSSTAAVLQDRGLIRQRHGRIQVLKPHGLATQAPASPRRIQARDRPP
jgi:CRP-like cAMP-binding protein